MFKLLRRLFCRHLWINILRVGGDIHTKYGTYTLPEDVAIDYCPKCNYFRERR